MTAARESTPSCQVRRQVREPGRLELDAVGPPSRWNALTGTPRTSPAQLQGGGRPGRRQAVGGRGEPSKAEEYRAAPAQAGGGPPGVGAGRKRPAADLRPLRALISSDLVARPAVPLWRSRWRCPSLTTWNHHHHHHSVGV